jgi:hypothetical protein
VFAFIDEGATVMAETGLVRGGPTLISFNTTFADGSVVETMYPRGESIHDPDFHSGHNSVSLAAAYAEQQLEIDRWRMHHGTPRLIHDMADYLRADADYRERFSKRKLRRPFLLYQLLPIVLVVGVVLVVLSILAGFWPL